MDSLDQAVWGEVARLLQEPHRVEQEYRQRLQPSSGAGGVGAIQTQVQKLRRGRARLIDAYTDGLLEKADFESRLSHLRERIRHLEQEAQHLQDVQQEEQELRLLVGQFDRFAQQVREGLDHADWTTRRASIRALVKRVEIDQEQVQVVFRVSPTPPPAPMGTDPASLQHCVGRVPTRAVHRALTLTITSSEYVLLVGKSWRGGRSQVLPLKPVLSEYAYPEFHLDDSWLPDSLYGRGGGRGTAAAHLLPRRHGRTAEL